MEKKHKRGNTRQRGAQYLLVLIVVGLLARIALPLTTGKAPRIDGLPEPVRPITLVRLEHSQILQRLSEERQYEKGLASRCSRIGQIELGLVQHVEAPIMLPMPSLIDLVAPEEIPPAFYAAGTDSVFLPRGDHLTLAHEWVHAIDDQVSDRIAHAADPSRPTDERVALRAAIEGSAIVLSEGRSVTLPLTGDFDSNIWAFAYTLGPAYVLAAGGNTPADILHLAPKTTQEILTLQQVDPVEPAPGPPLPDGKKVLCSDRLGALALATLIQQVGGDPSESRMMASAWLGDRMEVEANQDGRRQVTWHIVLSDSAALDIWRSRVSPSMAKRKNVRLIESVLVDDHAPSRASRVERLLPAPQ